MLNKVYGPVSAAKNPGTYLIPDIVTDSNTNFQDALT